MKKELRYIFDAILNNIAPARFGIIELKEAYRIYSNDHTLNEVKECLDEFLKHKIAKKARGEEIYIFPRILSDAIKSLESKEVNLSKKLEKLKAEHSMLSNEIETLQELENLWQENLNKLDLGVEVKINLQTHISLSFEGSVQRIRLKKEQLEKKIKMLNRKIGKLKERKRKLLRYL